ncbi:MAG: low specificity L-threonine aldolase [Rhizobiales bacterium]|nr:beta-eliminating lyase-related protein [Hyphomicrobiales bacterium]NRB12970.1 low specificity L-threonine aldolase [Hyphomicrobiales bacterium]
MINLHSDTQTKPTAEMRKFMAAAPVGDEQQLLDPSVNLLCEKSAKLLGKEAAVFLPSGIMCNLVSVLTHCRMGDELIAADNSHMVMMEAGGMALGQVSCQTIDKMSGIFNVDDIKHCVAKRRMGKNSTIPKMLVVENTHNFGGGVAWTMDELNPVTEYCQRQNMKLHMDGARLLNASIATGTTPAQYAKQFDSVWFDLSKGLGCPVGAVLAGSEEFIQQVWVWKTRLGGAMRQAGIIAAAGIYALDNHVDLLAQDHKNAKNLATALNNIENVSVNLKNLHTNIIMINIRNSAKKATDICTALKAKNVAMVALNEHEIRAVTHLDVSADECEQAAAIFANVMNN